MAFICSASIAPFFSTRRSEIFSSPVKNRFCTSSRTQHQVSRVNMTNIVFPSPTENISLPQNDSSPERRRRQIEQTRRLYEWSQESIGGASMIKGLPKTEIPKIAWVLGVVQVLIRVALNTVAIKLNNAHEAREASRSKVLSQIAALTARLLGSLTSRQFDRSSLTETINKASSVVYAEIAGAGRNLNDYRELFKVYQPDIVSVDPYLSDDVFGWYRVAGPNPMKIKKLEKPVSELFPELSDKILQGIPAFGNDTIESLQSEQRLFYVSYPEFSGVESGVLPDGTRKDGYYVYSPTALLAVPKSPDERTTVLPIAIRCDQDMNFPMYTSNKAHTDATTWSAAKLTVQVADGVIHEAVYHLGRTHLLVEVFHCAARRSMASVHPIMKLLEPHFYGTCLINTAAVIVLVNPGGIVDRTTAPQIENTTKLAANAVNSATFSFNNWMPDKELASRGVLHAEKLRFPYRDFAVRLWEAITEWVSAYVGAFYKSDIDVRNDKELATWSSEIIDGSKGNLHGFGDNESGEIKTKDYLIRMVSMIIFTASVQHSAVNFPQSSLMQFAPAMPLSGYYPAPNTEKPFQTFDEFVTKMVPDLNNAKLQMDALELIGVYQYTTLGEYGQSLKFSPEKVKVALKKFQGQLKLIGADVQKQNENEERVGLQPCFQLNPKNIPQSINI